MTSRIQTTRGRPTWFRFWDQGLYVIPRHEATKVLFSHKATKVLLLVLSLWICVSTILFFISLCENSNRISRPSTER